MKSNKIEFITFAKGYAMLSIVFFHFFGIIDFNSWINKAILFGGTGVHLFIFLSGFGLQLSETKQITSFYKKRFIKIYIPFILFITFLFIFNQFIQLNYKINLYAYLGHIFLFNMFDNNIIASFGIQYWFIATIIQFYLVFPILSKLINNTSGTFFLSISIIISILYWILIYYFNLYELRIWNSSFLQFLWEFNLGMFMGKKYIEKGYKFWEQKNSVLLIFAFFNIILMAVLAIKGETIGKIFNDIPAFIGYTALCIYLYHIFDTYCIRIKDIIIKIGIFSYSLFLIHWFVIKIFIIFLDKININFNVYFLIIIIPVTLLFSKLYHKLNSIQFKIVDNIT